MNPVKLDSVESCVALIVKDIGKELIVGSPLGIGKPNHLLNALWKTAKHDPSISLEIFTALSLEVPKGKSLLEQRFLQSFTARHFGDDYPELDYIDDIKRGDVPGNMKVSEFYMQSGKYLSSPLAQRWYTSSNYTHVARDMANRGVNVLSIMVGCENKGGELRYSLGSNPDVTLDLVRRVKHSNKGSLYIVAVVNRNMPFMTGQAEVGEDFFNIIIDQPQYEHPLFAVPREPISTTDYMIGLHASTLIADGGSLQIGIGALGDAFVYATELRHRDAAAYQNILQTTGIAARFSQLIESVVGPINTLSAFSKGLYAATEMFTEGFIHLYKSKILKRLVYPDLTIQTLLNEEKITADISLATLDALMQARAVTTRLDQTELQWLITTGVFRADVQLQDNQLLTPSGKKIANNLADPASREAIAEHCLGQTLAGGALMHAAFFLGSKDFYRWLHQLSHKERDLFQMTGVGQINELYDGEPRDRAQRLKARFINSTMKVSLTGAACSDGLDNHQVVSGVGGQYNFVAMAHALADSRSILMLRATRNASGGAISNIVWQYPYETIPRHLRDIVITEYGMADLRGKSDEDCIKAMICIADSRFQSSLVEQAQQNNKLDPAWQVPEAFSANTAARLQQGLSRFQQQGLFESYPYGCDFNDEELQLVNALSWLKPKTSSAFAMLKLLLKTIGQQPSSAHMALVERMGLSTPASFEERVSQRLLLLALHLTAG